MQDDKIIIRSENPEETRKFVKVYHDFLESDLLNRNEKMVFILLKRYLDFRDDHNGIDGSVFPSLKTLAKQCSMTEKTIRETIKSLQDKKILTINRRGLNKPNEYVLRDYANVWKAVTDEEANDIMMQERLHLAARIAKDYGYSLIKEKEPVSESTKTTETSPKSSNVITDIKSSNGKSQERYTMDELKILYEYDNILYDQAANQRDLDTVFDILYDILNSTKPTIRIAGEDKPTLVVVSKLMKLDRYVIVYAIDRFNQQMDQIKNPVSYMTTLLYKAQEQYTLEMNNTINRI